MIGSRFSIEYVKDKIILKYYFTFTDATVQRLKLTNPAVAEVIGEWWENGDSPENAIERYTPLYLDYDVDVTVYTRNVEMIFGKALEDNVTNVDPSLMGQLRVTWDHRTDYSLT